MKRTETWMISDLHLDQARPSSTASLMAFLAHIEDSADALYVLGDLFEFWLGDDALQHPDWASLLPILDAFKRVSDSGVKSFFIHGNRDFLIGDVFAQKAGWVLLPEETVIDLYGQATVILHGDSLCTDDAAYQKAREMWLNPKWQEEKLALSLEDRLAEAQAMRQQSAEHKSQVSEAIMDVNLEAVAACFKRNGVRDMIHGHTHRPGMHDIEIDDQDYCRVVLGDWYERPNFLRITPSETGTVDYDLADHFDI